MVETKQTVSNGHLQTVCQALETDTFDKCQSGEQEATAGEWHPSTISQPHTHPRTHRPWGSYPVVILIALLYILYFSRPQTVASFLLGKIQCNYTQSTPYSQRKMNRQVQIYSFVSSMEKPGE